MRNLLLTGLLATLMIASVPIVANAYDGRGYERGYYGHPHRYWSHDHWVYVPASAYYPGYYPQPVYVAPPQPVYYAPAPAYYAPPAVSVRIR